MKPSELLSSPDKWTQGAYARNKAGNGTFSHDPRAVCWCLTGAINKCFSVDNRIALIKLRVIVGNSIVTFNDTPGRTFEEIHNALIQAGL